MKQYKIKILGRVQGVGFRYFAQQKAKDNGLTGWVKNTVGGGVDIMIKGEEKDISTFVEFLKIGSPLSRVDKLTIRKIDILSDFDTFIVKY